MDTTTRERFLAGFTDRVVLELILVAHQLCGLMQSAQGRRISARTYEPLELLNEAVARVLGVSDASREDRPRAWREDVPLTAFMCMVMKSIVTELRRLVETTRSITYAPRELAVAGGSDGETRRRSERSEEILTDLLELLRDDSDACAYVLCLWEYSDKRADVAQKLDWPLAKVDRVRRKVHGIIQSAGSNKLRN